MGCLRYTKTAVLWPTARRGVLAGILTGLLTGCSETTVPPATSLLSQSASSGATSAEPIHSNAGASSLATHSADGGSQAEPPEQSALPVLGTVSDFQLQDQSGQNFALEQLKGRVSIVNFVFTQCTATCPKQAEQYRELQSRFSKTEQWPAIQLISVSIDPAHDSQETLSAYARQLGADTSHWKFLTGARDEAWRLSREVFRLAVGHATNGSSGELFHSSQFVLVDQDGLIRGYFDGMNSASLRTLSDAVLQLAAAGVLADDQQKPATDDAIDEDALKVIDGSFDQVASGRDAAENPVAMRRLYAPSRSYVEPNWLESRATRQREEVAKVTGLFHDFRFTDRLSESGINFIHRIVDDAGKTYKAAHYDHGTGLAIAEVDGDGRVDVLFVNQLGGNGLYRNLGRGKFEDITASSGVELADRIKVAASFADIDNDGDADLFVTSVRGGNVLFANDGKGHFQDVTESAGLSYDGHSSGAVFFDYDRDGLLDLFVCNVGKYTTEEIGRGGYFIARTDAFAAHLKPELSEKSLLYRNLGGMRFKDVTTESGLVDESWTGDASTLDANQDGWPDLYVLNMQGHDEYYENVEGKKFVRRSREIFPKTPWGSMGIKVCDFDNDGAQDIFITDMHSDMSQVVDIDREKEKADMKFPESMLRSEGKSIFGNAFFHRQSDGTYQEVSDRIGAENFWPWGLSVGDLNADGYEDAFVASSMNLPFRYGVNSVLLNDHGRRFVDSEFVVGVEPRRDGRTSTPWFQLDASGADSNHPYLQKAGIRQGMVEVWSALGSRSSVIFDLDDDGDLDIITNDLNSEPMVLISNLAEVRPIHYLKIQLVGSRSNRDGLGAVVVVKAGGQTYTRVHDGKSGYLSQSTGELYFGLNDAESVDEVVVTWPSGQVQKLSGDQLRKPRTVVTEP
ncbi:MAG: FG-GAP-like repeat-containing protein [Pirellulales bacterium]